MKSTTETLVLWEQRIKERTESGMSVSKWGKVNEISKNMYHYWNRKINKQQQSDNETEFAEVTSVISNVDKPEINHWKWFCSSHKISF